MYFGLLLILFVAGCRATLLRYPMGTARTWPQAGEGPHPTVAVLSCGEAPPHYQDLSCDSVESLNLGPGLIISGQGGSATRAAQEVVQFAGTHDFGKLDNYTCDSCACRWGQCFVDRETVLIFTGRLDYKVEDIPSKVRATVEHKTCTTLAMLKQMLVETGSLNKMPWAMKEPWLRVLLPFYTSKLDVKFVHVTRDVRSIHETHNDERFGWSMKDIEEVARLGYSVLPKDTIQQAHAAGKNAFLNVKNLPGVDAREEFPVVDFQKYAIFAHVWANFELALYKSWTSTQPQKYFHISEVHMTNETTKKNFTRDLAHFLGNLDPSEDTLGDMMSVYQPEEMDPERISHWKMMQAIIDDPSSGIIREALSTFGYTV